MNVFLFAFTLNSSNFSPAAFSNLGQLITIIITVLASLTGAATAIFIVIAGIKFITSSGDPKGVASARSTLIYALIGLVVTILAFIILQTTQYFIGNKYDLVNPSGGGPPGGGGASCGLGSSSAKVGDLVGISYGDFSAGLDIFIYDGSAVRRSLGSTQAGPGPFWINVTIPSLTPGSYGVFIDALGFGNVNCGPLTITSSGGGGAATMSVVPSGSTVRISWGAIPGWPTGSTYLLGVYPTTATGCPPTIGNILSPAPTFTSGSGGSYTLPAVPNGNYKAALYTFAPGPLSNCPNFVINTTFVMTCNKADVNGDGSVTVLDQTLVSNLFGVRTGDPRFIASYDFNSDGVINTLELALLGRFIGQTC